MKPVKSENIKAISDTEYNHPAFGQISVSRVSAGGKITRSLYGSEFKPSNFISIAIEGSALQRSLSRDWYFQRGQKIEVHLTEAQWATFVSSIGMGAGSPCTIARESGNSVPDIEWQDDPQKKYQAEYNGGLDDAISELKQTLDGIENMTISKKNKENLRGPIVKAIQEITVNRKYVQDSFAEYMEESVEEAKSEIHGYMTGVVQSAGLESLKNRSQDDLAISYIEND